MNLTMLRHDPVYATPLLIINTMVVGKFQMFSQLGAMQNQISWVQELNYSGKRNYFAIIWSKDNLTIKNFLEYFTLFTELALEYNFFFKINKKYHNNY